MATQLQLAANRANAQLSTGTTSSEGKLKVSHNAVKTGLTGRTVVLPSDDIAAYDQHVASAFAQWKPHDNTSRRDLLKTAALAGLTGGVTGTPAAAAPTPSQEQGAHWERPPKQHGNNLNLIVLVSDTFRADNLKPYGSEWVETPNEKYKGAYQPQLYNRKADPHELKDVAQAHSNVTKELQAKLDEYIASGWDITKGSFNEKVG